jgi:hypothetical protein
VEDKSLRDFEVGVLLGKVHGREVVVVARRGDISAVDEEDSDRGEGLATEGEVEGGLFSVVLGLDVKEFLGRVRGVRVFEEVDEGRAAVVGSGNVDASAIGSDLADEIILEVDRVFLVHVLDDHVDCLLVR